MAARRPKGQLELAFDAEAAVARKILRLLEPLPKTGRWGVVQRVQATMTTAHEADLRERVALPGYELPIGPQ